MPKRRVLLVDDEVTVLLTMKAVLEISGFDVDTAASAREGQLKLKQREYQMVITDMRMESDAAGREVIQAARTAAYHPAVALLTAYPMADDDWQAAGADKMLVKPMQTGTLLRQLEKLLDTHAAKLQRLSLAAAASGVDGAATPGSSKAAPRKSAGKKPGGSATVKPRARGLKEAAKKKSAKKASARKVAR